MTSPGTAANAARINMLSPLGLCNLTGYVQQPDDSLKDSMIIGSGIDMVEIARIQQSLDRYGQRFLNRVYTAAEMAYCMRKRNAAESLAARFAAKEAGAKALGTGISRGVNWLEIEVGREPGGRPTLHFHGRAAEIAVQLGVV